MNARSLPQVVSMSIFLCLGLTTSYEASPTFWNSLFGLLGHPIYELAKKSRMGVGEAAAVVDEGLNQSRIERRDQMILSMLRNNRIDVSVSSALVMCTFYFMYRVAKNPRDTYRKCKGWIDSAVKAVAGVPSVINRLGKISFETSVAGMLALKHNVEFIDRKADASVAQEGAGTESAKPKPTGLNSMLGIESFSPSDDPYLFTAFLCACIELPRWIFGWMGEAISLRVEKDSSPKESLHRETSEETRNLGDSGLFNSPTSPIGRTGTDVVQG